MVQKCPDVIFILDHLGKPNIKNKIIEPWKTEIKKLSSYPNVFCKISGITTEADHNLWTKDDLVPYIHHVIDCFGIDRVIYGSDWFMMSQASSYDKWIEALDHAFSAFSKNDQKKFYVQNACKVYKIND